MVLHCDDLKKKFKQQENKIFHDSIQLFLLNYANNMI